jgi:hypothetical protein
MNDLVKLLVNSLNGTKVGGWVRASVAAGLGAVAVAFGGEIGEWVKAALTPEVITGIAVAVSAAVVGIWSQVTKHVNKDPEA